MADWISDPTLWVYGATLLVAIYGAGLFFWWWAKQGGASAVFSYVSFLFVGELFESGISFYSRCVLFIHGDVARDVFVMSGIWPLRKVVTLTALIFIVAHMTGRVLGKTEAGLGRRRED
jgi:hypothetical protein